MNGVEKIDCKVMVAFSETIDSTKYRTNSIPDESTLKDTIYTTFKSTIESTFTSAIR